MNYFILQPPPHPARSRCLDAIRLAPDGYAVSIKEATRTLEQNAAQWPYLEGFAKQKQLCINGVMGDTVQS